MEQTIIETIERYDRIIIHRHVRPDPDAYGSQVGLKTLLRANYPEKEVYAAGEHEERLSFLATQDDVSEQMYEGALIIITDTGNTERIDSAYYEKGAYVIKIDHHPNNDPYGDLRWVDTTSSSTSELIYRLFKKGEQLRNWTLPHEAARLLYAGIVADTSRFLYPSTTNATMRAAGELITYDFDRTALYDALYEVDEAVLRLQGYVYQQVKLDEYGSTSIRLTKEVLADHGLVAEDTGSLVSSLGQMKGITAWVLFVEEDDIIRARLRSKGPAINELASRYNGGGHPLASGASVTSWEEADELVANLRALCRTYNEMKG